MLQSQVNLRYYQDDAVNVFTVGGCKNGIIVCPTGAGKSIVISELAKRLNNTNVLVLQPRKEILEQYENLKKTEIAIEAFEVKL